MKFVPLTVSVKAAPVAVAVDGERAVMLGTGLFRGLPSWLPHPISESPRNWLTTKRGNILALITTPASAHSVQHLPVARARQSLRVGMGGCNEAGVKRRLSLGVKPFHDVINP